MSLPAVRRRFYRLLPGTPELAARMRDISRDPTTWDNGLQTRILRYVMDEFVFVDK